MSGLWGGGRSSRAVRVNEEMRFVCWGSRTSPRSHELHIHAVHGLAAILIGLFTFTVNDTQRPMTRVSERPRIRHTSAVRWSSLRRMPCLAQRLLSPLVKGTVSRASRRRVGTDAAAESRTGYGSHNCPSGSKYRRSSARLERVQRTLRGALSRACRASAL
ncbi:hypothetical protein Purlil1_11821 [Purpureocillium lilacinum]|uniref:Uncharacterized protein n=1 Tax=Purpureocillium lilacinum TaxID=33203 RepID=A0ABR0BIK5_PURLI|nr:hypothetical protein Purlil1_11821 [Purpureocillium lilacinum]